MQDALELLAHVAVLRVALRRLKKIAPRALHIAEEQPRLPAAVERLHARRLDLERAVALLERELRLIQLQMARG